MCSSCYKQWAVVTGASPVCFLRVSISAISALKNPLPVKNFAYPLQLLFLLLLLVFDSGTAVPCMSQLEASTTRWLNQRKLVSGACSEALYQNPSDLQAESKEAGVNSSPRRENVCAPSSPPDP